MQYNEYEYVDILGKKRYNSNYIQAKNDNLILPEKQITAYAL